MVVFWVRFLFDYGNFSSLNETDSIFGPLFRIDVDFLCVIRFGFFIFSFLSLVLIRILSFDSFFDSVFFLF